MDQSMSGKKKAQKKAAPRMPIEDMQDIANRRESAMRKAQKKAMQKKQGGGY